MLRDHEAHAVGLSPLMVAIVAIICAAAVLITYHCIIAQWCNEEVPDASQSPPRLQLTSPPSSFENSVAELIPSYKYSKDISLVSKTQDGGTCSVCLCEFMDGEQVRILPECLHSFHVSCIDMWLMSSANCPLCRAGTPTPARRHTMTSDSTPPRQHAMSGGSVPPLRLPPAIDEV